MTLWYSNVSLSRRLALTLITLLVLLGAVIAWAGRYASELYFHEVNQTLNASLSMYVVERLTLFENADVNEQAFRELADLAMTVNPSAEVYLLDTAGTVVAHALPEGAVLHENVDLEPITTFVSGNNPGLILGADPRSDTRKAFSASPVIWNGENQGYLYVILGGRLFDEVRASFLGTFIGRIAIASLVAVLLVGGVAGYIALRSVTRPLESLAESVARYSNSGFTETQSIREVPENTNEVHNLKRQILQLTDKLDAQFEQLQTNDRLRRELLANISHDLRTPLTSMQGYLETLLIKKQQLTTVEQQKYLEIAHHKVNRLSLLVGSLFELAKLDSGAIDPELDAFPIAELLNDVMQDFEIDAREKGVALRIRGLEAHSDIKVLADIRLIQRVLENLISNALIHTSEGGHIDISLAKRFSAVAIDVRDDGSGIEAELLPTIFDRYASGKATQESAGLGLAIVKRILELHDTQIRVTSTSNAGTCFSFELHQAA